MFYHFKIHKESNGYWAECIELDGCITQGDTLKELEYNMFEALNLYLDEPSDSKVIFPLPKKSISGKNIKKVPVDSKIAFSLYLKHYRNKRGLTQKQVASLLGMKNIYSYQRLESSKSANPSLKTIEKIKSVFPEFKLDDVVST